MQETLCLREEHEPERRAMASKTTSDNVNTLPFRHQFAAGAVAGISEVYDQPWKNI
jgi:hypothetical protein